MLDPPFLLADLPQTGRLHRQHGRRRYSGALLFMVLSSLAVAFSIFGVSRQLHHGEPGSLAGAVRPDQAGASSATGRPVLRRVDDERRLPPDAARGKQYLAQALSALELKKAQEASGPPASENAREALKMLAYHLSGGFSRKIVGQTVRLEEIAPFDDSVTQTFGTEYEVTRFLGEGLFSLILEVKDKESQRFFALRVPFGANQEDQEEIQASRSTSEDEDSDEEGDSTEERVTQELSELLLSEEEGIRTALDKTPAAKGASHRGIAVPLATAELEDMPADLYADGLVVSNKVQLTELFYGDLETLVEHSPLLPLDAKVYIAQRLLLQVLYLQEIGACHNDLKLSSCFMRADGSFLLGDFASTNVAGTEAGKFVGATLAFIEPELFMSIKKGLETATPVVPEAKSDLWSLGALLYELFTGDLPYGLSAPAHSMDRLYLHLTELLQRDISSAVLVPDMTKSHVPERWQELLTRLLQVKREKRISADEVMREFSDLWQ